MSGIKNLNFPQFHKVAAELRSNGYEVISPAEVELSKYPKGYVPFDKEDAEEMYNAFMKEDIKQMMDCDTVAVLEGWQKSKGAQIEVGLAFDLGMNIVNADTLEKI